jgi:hypothetical protein
MPFSGKHPFTFESALSLSIMLVLRLQKGYSLQSLSNDRHLNVLQCNMIKGAHMTAPEKIVLFAFRGDPLCFIHVLLNAIDLHERGQEGHIVIEGEAVKLVSEMSEPAHFLWAQYQKVKELGLIAGVCKACSKKLGVADAARQEGLPLLDDMFGHPSMGAFLEKGFKVITF